MTVPIFQVDAFTQEPFSGNPAAVCPLPQWPTEQWMQNVAAENNLSETAFVVKGNERYEIRWFTPSCEVDLCGHATLASAFVLWQYLGETAAEIIFDSASGPLQVARDGDSLQLNFPCRPVTDPISTGPEQVAAALGAQPVWAGQMNGRCLVELANESSLAALQPDMRALRALPYDVVLVTAASEHYDFVCRVFAPKKGVDEDPVTGSAFTTFSPYWAAKLNKNYLQAKQISRRGGVVTSTLSGERVLIAGHAVCVMRGELLLPFTAATG